jgi:hypothetical protein
MVSGIKGIGGRRQELRARVSHETIHRTVLPKRGVIEKNKKELDTCDVEAGHAPLATF